MTAQKWDYLGQHSENVSGARMKSELELEAVERDPSKAKLAKANLRSVATAVAAPWRKSARYRDEALEGFYDGFRSASIDFAVFLPVACSKAWSE